jgi:hypothetical protein
MRETNAPDIVIEFQEMISKMTVAEYRIFCDQQRKAEEEEYKKAKNEYAKHNPIKKSIVDEIYNRESKLSYDYFIHLSNLHWLSAINPLSFMSQDDLDNGLYEAFLDHAREVYQQRFKENWDADNEKDNGIL